MIFGARDTKMNKTRYVPVRVWSPVSLEQGKTGRREANYADTEQR